MNMIHSRFKSAALFKRSPESLRLVSGRLNARWVFHVISAGVFQSCVKEEWRRGRNGVEVMDLFMLCSPSMAERYEGRSYGCLYITLWDP